MIKFKTVTSHFFFWCLYISWEILAVWIVANRAPHILSSSLHYVATIGVFYLNRFILMPFLTKRFGQTLSIVLVIPVFFTFYISLHLLADWTIVTLDATQQSKFSGVSKSYLLANIYRGVPFLSVSLVYYYFSNYLKSIIKEYQYLNEKNLIEKKLTVSQNLYLKAQINPHFLFNVLHFINYKLDPKSEASEALLRLSNIMHFAFSSKDAAETIRIGDELTQVEELVALQEMRGNRFEGLKISYDLVVCDLRLIPLVLLTLVENVYKHGDLSNNAAFLSLDIDEDQELLVIKTLNQIGGQQLPSDQTGMDNIRTRLVNAYGDATQFEYGIRDDSFQVRIALPFSAVKP